MRGERKYPKAVAPDKVGDYRGFAKSGGGYFYDDVLEYRVWCHSDNGTDFFHAFATFEDAAKFSDATPEAEEPLVLIRQCEWISEAAPGQFAHERSERIAEWRVEWLTSRKRAKGSIEKFLQNKSDA